MSSLIPLKLPDAEEPSAWDSTIDDLDGFQASSNSLSITPHAVAYKSLVCGINQHQVGSASSSSSSSAEATAEGRPDEEWIQWSTSFSPHRVASVVSNTDGSIVAVATEAGTVSLLRGCDGAVLATRRVVNEALHLPPVISLVTSQQRHSDTASQTSSTTTSAPSTAASLDTLVVQPPVDRDGPILLVSNIDGSRLNCNNKAIISEATRSMGFHIINVPAEAPFSAGDIRQLRGCYLRDKSHVIRFAIIDVKGQLMFLDYDLNQKQIAFVQHQMPFSDGQEWTVDFGVDATVQYWKPRQQSYLVVSAFKQSASTKVCWIDVESVSVAFEYVVKDAETTQQTVALIETVNAHDDDEAKALLIATKPSRNSDRIKLQIVQLHIEETMGLAMLGKPHTIFTMDLKQSSPQISVARVGGNAAPYSFRAITATADGAKEMCHLFHPKHTASVGYLRLLIELKHFDKAQQYMASLDSAVLIKDSFANFHPSEISLAQLKHILTCGNISNGAAIQQSRNCVQQLVVGALSSPNQGFTHLIAAGDVLLAWPDPSLRNPPLLKEVEMALKGFLAALAPVQASFNAKVAPPSLTQLQHRVQSKVKAIEFLSVAVSDPTSSSNDIRFDKDFADIQSPQLLFGKFLRLGFFDAAEMLWKSDLNGCLSSEVQVDAIQQIPPSIDPRHYAMLLFDMVLPSLAINHGLLPTIVNWTCATADRFDEDHDENGENTLAESIYILQRLDEAIKNLRLRIHSSYASYTPFTGKSHSPQHNASSSLSLDNRNLSMDSIGSAEAESTRSTDKRKGDEEMDSTLPVPSILQMNRLNGGAKKARSASVPRLRWDDILAFENTLEVKLQQAFCLKKARNMGLAKDRCTLKTFIERGGIKAVTKQLLRHYSRSASTHAARKSAVDVQITSFCTFAGIDLDTSLLEYAHSLCGGKKATVQAIEEAASIALCSVSIKTKCEITLVSLRAALFCHHSPGWLGDLSKQAIEWSSADTKLKSELEEASRLLLIDGILGRYCGGGSREVFHVDNPRHAYRLLQFICGHIQEESMLTDALDLCQAFHHLTEETACTLILQATIEAGDLSKCCAMLRDLKARDAGLALKTFPRVLDYCMNGVAEFSSSITVDRERFRSFASTVHQILPIGIELHNSTSIDILNASTWDDGQFEILLGVFDAIVTLQRDHDVQVSYHDLNDTKALLQSAVDVIAKILDAIADTSPDLIGNTVTRCKRILSLYSRLCDVSEETLWYISAGIFAYNQAQRRSNPSGGVDALRSLSLLLVADNEIVSRSCLAITLSIYEKAMSVSTQSTSSIERVMRDAILATSLVQTTILPKCSKRLLASSTDFAELADVVSDIFVRCDDGVGERLDRYKKQLNLQDPAPSSLSDGNKTLAHNNVDVLQLRLLNLHQTWYVGDGLLLPPMDALVLSREYSQYAVIKTTSAPVRTEQLFRLHQLLEEKGSLFLALRVLVHNVTTTGGSPNSFSPIHSIADVSQDLHVALAERCIGGTNNGIISGSVDSELALTFLLNLPTKVALRLYGSSLPTAISTRNFQRVITIASIGKVAGSPWEMFSTRKENLLGWKKQQRFVDQCHSIYTSAYWWQVMQSIGLVFDPLKFDILRSSSSRSSSSKPNSKASKDNAAQRPSAQYATTLVLPFMRSIANQDCDTHSMLRMAYSFLESFNAPVTVAIEKYVDFILTCSHVTEESSKSGGYVERRRASLGLVPNLLKFLKSGQDRTLLLRNCIVKIETATDHGTDYEHMAHVLDLYHSQLSSYIHSEGKQTKLDKRYLWAELDTIDRRRDALAILLSFFQDSRRKHRPLFSSFFLPLRASLIDAQKEPRVVACDVLGEDPKAQAATSLDPLKSLQPLLESDMNMSVSSALAPISLAFGIPKGYLQARALMARFDMSNHRGMPKPSFESDVQLVLNKLQSSSDKAKLAEWCSLQYSLDSTDKMACLDMALSCAIQASKEAEAAMSDKRAMGSETSRISDRINEALTRVRRISTAKDLLSDRVSINAILHSSSDGRNSQDLKYIIEKLVERLDEKVWKAEEFVPEDFVHTFLAESSLLAADMSLDAQRPLSIGSFHQFSSIAQRACRSLAEKYSHVQVDAYCERLARNWLFAGKAAAAVAAGNDGSIHSKGVAEAVQDMNLSAALHEPELEQIDEDDTINFVMDLSSLQRSEAEAPRQSKPLSPPEHNNGTSKLTSQEEPTSIKRKGCARQESEYACRLDALRIAFVLSFTPAIERLDLGRSCLDLHDDTQEPLGAIDTNANDAATEREQKQQKPRLKLLSRIGSKGSAQRKDPALHYSRFLLDIVFASSNNESVQRDRNASFETASTTSARMRSHKNQAITFTMRHRALRTACILCPREALEEVAREEGYTRDGRGEYQPLKLCTYSAFIAKEIEEMGLPLPHSNLAQLGVMHFPSYARTLWRHHRSDDACKTKGRLLLLILEMYLKEPISDPEFFQNIVTTIIRLRLPRTMLLACQCIARCKTLVTSKEPMIDTNTVDIVKELATQFQQRVLKDLELLPPSTIADKDDHRDAVSTLKSFCSAIEQLSRINRGDELLQHVTDGFLQKLQLSVDERWKAEYAKRVEGLVGHMDKTMKVQFQDKIREGPTKMYFQSSFATKRSWECMTASGSAGGEGGAGASVSETDSSLISILRKKERLQVR